MNKEKVGQHAHTTAVNLTQIHDTEFKVAEDITERLMHSSFLTHQGQISIQAGKS